MKKNMGTVDKAVRSLYCNSFITLYFANVITGTMAIALLMFASFILTSFASFCPFIIHLIQQKWKIEINLFSLIKNSSNKTRTALLFFK
jgi:hypothetical protein